jgi:hypothetical protein
MYLFTLYLHLVALLLAFFATGMLAGGSILLRRAERVADARLALALSAMAGKIHPISTLGLLLTGAYLTQSRWSWSSPWILCGLVGLILVAIVGVGVLGSRERALAKILHEAPEGPLLPALRARLNDPLMNVAGPSISFFVLGIVLIMVMKPDLPACLLTLALAAVLGTAVGYVTQPAAAARTMA